MKRTLFNIIAFVFVVAAFVSCDVIPENDRYIEVEQQGGERVQRLLIEEFTVSLGKFREDIPIDIADSLALRSAHPINDLLIDVLCVSAFKSCAIGSILLL